jgi:hypothetical protein
MGSTRQKIQRAAQLVMKVVIIDVPRPQHGVFMADISPSHLPPK